MLIHTTRANAPTSQSEYLHYVYVCYVRICLFAYNASSSFLLLIIRFTEYILSKTIANFQYIEYRMHTMYCI
jgi:hypothetical protein